MLDDFVEKAEIFHKKYKSEEETLFFLTELISTDPLSQQGDTHISHLLRAWHLLFIKVDGIAHYDGAERFVEMLFPTDGPGSWKEVSPTVKFEAYGNAYYAEKHYQALLSSSPERDQGCLMGTLGELSRIFIGLTYLNPRDLSVKRYLEVDMVWRNLCKLHNMGQYAEYFSMKNHSRVYFAPCFS